MEGVTGRIPPLDDNGLLPPGVWDCSLSEICERFATTPHRKGLWDGLLQFLEAEVRPLGSLSVWIDGSFTRAKPSPEDIDVVLDFSAADLAAVAYHILSFRVRHDELKERYHVDVWTRHPAVENDLAAFFQYAGEKCAAELRVDRKHPKGILRVQL